MRAGWVLAEDISEASPDCHYEKPECLLPSLVLHVPPRRILVCRMALQECQCRDSISTDAAPPGAHGPHLGVILQRSCTCESTGRKMTGVGWCFLVHLEKAKISIQAVKTFKELTTSNLRKKKPIKPTNRTDLQVL